MRGNTSRFSGTSATPAVTMRAGVSPVSSAPSSRIAPRCGFRMPAIDIISVVLPAPFGPSSEAMRTASARSETPFRASILPSAVTGPEVSSMPPADCRRGAEMSLASQRIGLHRRRGTLGDLLAEIEHRDTVGDRHHQLDVMLDQQDAGALAAQRADAAIELADLLGV